MQDKRAQQIKNATPNPFVKPGELPAYATGLSEDFDKALAKQTAALQPAK
jgi:metallo-beta-lactamase class B